MASWARNFEGEPTLRSEGSYCGSFYPIILYSQRVAEPHHHHGDEITIQIDPPDGHVHGLAWASAETETEFYRCRRHRHTPPLSLYSLETLDAS